MRTYYTDQLSIAQIANDCTTSVLDCINTFIIDSETKLSVYATLKVKWIHKVYEQDIKDADNKIHKIFAFAGKIIIDNNSLNERPFTGIYETEKENCTFHIFNT